MLEQHGDDGVTGLVVGLVHAELGEALVLADEIGRRVFEQVEEVLEVGLRGRRLQIQHHLGVGCAVLEDLERAAGVLAAGVVVDPKLAHAGRVGAGAVGSAMGGAAGEGGTGRARQQHERQAQCGPSVSSPRSTT
jgi:hypothetical protein